MVASKGRALGGIRILHDAVISNEEKDFKLYGNERAGDGTIASIPKFPRKPVLGNAYSKSNVHTDLRNAKGKLHSGRKALADISNAKKERSQQFPSWPSNKPKLIRIDKSERTTRMKSEEAIMLRGKINNGKSADGCMLTLAKGITVADVSSIRSNRLLQGMQNSFAQISQRHIDCQSRRRKIETNVIEKNQINLLYIGSKSRKNHIEKVSQIRFLVEKQKNTKTTTTSTKPAPNSSKLQRTLMTSKASNTEMFEITKHVGNKKKDVPRALCNPIKAVGSQTQCLSSIGNECSNNSVNKTMSTYKSNRRKSYTLSLVVDSLPNIDDSTNPLEVVEYVDDIYHYYWTMEVERPCLANYMEIQSEITPKMRCVLVNWLIEVHHKYQLMEESLFLMIELLDRLLSIVNIKKE
ncbi:hypothetical protein HPP92_010214 [Vanilla planifolia]|uniref:Cyclin N-terminal domain-containing protein n=1 Tax=Vanilla planifolia TaxID=51239 RepID=A0A835QY60_VANPL|nr:hypothetical protein HPP92_010214 [Vanilla planifolia]